MEGEAAVTAERLPCGCVMGTQDVDGTPTFFYQPCALDCRYYLYVLEESKAQGKRTTIVDAQ